MADRIYTSLFYYRTCNHRNGGKSGSVFSVLAAFWGRVFMYSGNGFTGISFAVFSSFQKDPGRNDRECLRTAPQTKTKGRWSYDFVTACVSDAGKKPLAYPFVGGIFAFSGNSIKFRLDSIYQRQRRSLSFVHVSLGLQLMRRFCISFPAAV